MENHLENGKRKSIKENAKLQKNEDEIAGSFSKDMLEPGSEKKSRDKRYLTKHMKLYPELYRSDVSIHPSYTDLKNLPYHVVCRRRVQRLRRQIAQQFQNDVKHCAMMQLFAIDGVRIERAFSTGISPKATNIPDFATDKQRRRINELLRDTY